MDFVSHRSWISLQLNENPSWFEERGLNSLGILGFLFAAANVTGASEFLETAEMLCSKHNYDLNMINQRMIAADDVNFSTYGERAP